MECILAHVLYNQTYAWFEDMHRIIRLYNIIIKFSKTPAGRLILTIFRKSLLVIFAFAYLNITYVFLHNNLNCHGINCIRNMHKAKDMRDQFKKNYRISAIALLLIVCIFT